MKKEDNYPEENKRKMGLKTKILFGAIIAISPLLTCGCEITDIGIRTRPYYGGRYRNYNYPTGYRYPGYNPTTNKNRYRKSLSF